MPISATSKPAGSRLSELLEQETQRLQRALAASSEHRERAYLAEAHERVPAALGQMPDEDTDFLVANAEGQFSAERWSALASSPRKQARYVSDVLQDLTEEPVAQDAPDLCPAVRGPPVTARNLPCPPSMLQESAPGAKRAAAPPLTQRLRPQQVVEKLSPVQSTAGRLVRPGGLRRSVWVLPPGSGKTCMFIDVISNFLDQPDVWNVFLVGDADIFNSVVTELRRCPATYKGSDAKLPRLLREMNGEPGSEPGTFKYGAWCVLNNRAKKVDANHSSDCRGAPHVFAGTNIYWMTYLMFGNLLKNEDEYYPDHVVDHAGQPVPRKPDGAAYARYGHMTPFSKHSVWILDEAHKLLDPFEDQTSETWRPAYIRVGSALSRMIPEEEDDPIVAAFTATPGNVICLANIMKGRSRQIYDFRAPAQEDRRAVNPSLFRDPSYGFVAPAEALHVWPPWQDPRSATAAPAQAPKLREELARHGCLAPSKTEKISPKVAEALEHFPCAGGPAAAPAGPVVLRPRDEDKARKLLTLLTGLFFLVDVDTRFFPSLERLVRPVRPDGDAFWRKVQQVRAPPATKAAAKAAGGVPTWKELCNFADPAWLRRYVRERWQGRPHTQDDERAFENLAPKWHALRRDLLAGHLGRAVRVDAAGGRADVSAAAPLVGKTAVYLGAADCPSCSSTEFAVGLAYYLCAAPGGAWRNGFQPARGRPADFCSAPAVYVVADAREALAKSPVPAYLQPICKVDYRSSQIDVFKMPPCPGGSADAPALHKIVVLDVGAKKSLTLGCVSTLARMVSLDDVDEEQTKGRALRSCVFAGVPKDLWKVRLVDYDIKTAEMDDGDGRFNCDYALDAWNCAAGQLDRELLRLVARLSLACRNFDLFSRATRGHYAARCPALSAGGTTPFPGQGCLLEPSGGGPQQHAPALPGLDYWACWQDPATGRHEVRRAFSGDLSPRAVQRTSKACQPTSEVQEERKPGRPSAGPQEILRALHLEAPGAAAAAHGAPPAQERALKSAGARLPREKPPGLRDAGEGGPAQRHLAAGKDLRVREHRTAPAHGHAAGLDARGVEAGSGHARVKPPKVHGARKRGAGGHVGDAQRAQP
jgi:hypothetical protein